MTKPKTDIPDESTKKSEETPKAEAPKAPTEEVKTEPKAENASLDVNQDGKVKAESQKTTNSTQKTEKKPEKSSTSSTKKTEDKKDTKQAGGGQQFSPMKRRKRTSEYGQQLAEKQLAKKIYGVRERQFRNYYREAFRQQGDTGDILRQLLQMRLDNIIYQSGLAKTTPAARQMVSHNYFLINGKKVNIASYQVKLKDVITVKPEKEGKKVWDEEAKERIEEHDVPGWLALDKKTKTLKIVSKPTGDELNQEFNTRSIVEFYSR